MAMMVPIMGMGMFVVMGVAMVMGVTVVMAVRMVVGVLAHGSTPLI